MINYSIVMRSVNANLFDINQAKSRINKAKENGETPAQADLDLVATEKQNAFAIAQYADVMTIEKFAKNIATPTSLKSAIVDTKDSERIYDLRGVEQNRVKGLVIKNGIKIINN